MGEMTSQIPPAVDGLPFNTPLESALRLVIILAQLHPLGCDVHRLVTYDYFLVHSADLGGPPSLHPPSPNRTGELLVRRHLVVAGIDLAFRKGLILTRYEESGVRYYGSDFAKPFVEYFESSYAQRAKEIAGWLTEAFGVLSDAELTGLVDENLGRWGTEFAMEPNLEEN